MFLKLLLLSFGRLCLSSMTDNTNLFCDETYEHQTTCEFKIIDEWQPFLFDSKTLYVTYESIIEKYSDWHSKILFSAIPCENKKVIIFEPNAGLGDSVGGLFSAFRRSLQTGRFVNFF